MSFFVTGTDTGVGKTLVSTVLTVGLDSHYWKPLQTGPESDRDSLFLRQWIKSERIHPEAYHLQAPLSPFQASLLEGVGISWSRILEMMPQEKNLIVEGAGGVMVPICADKMMIDLMEDLELPVIVVASARVGTINHTLLTLEALQGAGLEVAGYIINGEKTVNQQEMISHFSDVKFLGEIPRTDKFDLDWFKSAFRRLRL